MITVACVLRSGGRYDAEWVRKLHDGVARNLSLPHRFVCLSDVDVPCERIALETAWARWWAKIELFRPGLLTGPTLYLDLDTVIVRPLDAIAAHPHRFTMVHEYFRPAFKCSTAMAWCGDFSNIWRAMDDTVPGRYDRRGDGRIGDQAFIEDNVQGVETFRDLFGERSIASYRVHCQSGPPKDAVAVAFHGKNKPDNIPAKWVQDAWR